jgi:hypothetical protein
VKCAVEKGVIRPAVGLRWEDPAVWPVLHSQPTLLGVFPVLFSWCVGLRPRCVGAETVELLNVHCRVAEEARF